MPEKPIPRALYGCHSCKDEYSRPADELFWSDSFQAWVCGECWRDYDEHWITDENGDNDSFCEYGISLEEELKNRK